MITEQPRLGVAAGGFHHRLASVVEVGGGELGESSLVQYSQLSILNISRNCFKKKSLTCMSSFPRAKSHAYPIYYLKIWPSSILSTSPV